MYGLGLVTDIGYLKVGFHLSVWRREREREREREQDTREKPISTQTGTGTEQARKK